MPNFSRVSSHYSRAASPPVKALACFARLQLDADHSALFGSSPSITIAGCADQSLIPIGPGGVTLQLPVNSARQSARLPQFQATLPADLHSTVWQAFSKAPDDNPVDQPKTTYDRQDVPATKPGMDAPESPDATNPEIDRSDYSAPGTNPDVGHNDPEDYKPDSDDVEDLKRRGRTGKSKLPGGQKAGAHGLFASQLGLSVSGLVYGTAAQSGGATRRMHVFASSNSDEGNVGKDKSAGAVVCFQLCNQCLRTGVLLHMLCL